MDQQPLQCSKTNKRCFQIEADALQFEISFRHQHNTEQQHPYSCEDCGFWHLSALPPGETTRARVNYNNIYAVRQRRSSEEQLELHTKVMELTTVGKTAKEISEELNIPLQAVYNLRSGKLSATLTKTVEGIEAKKLSIQEQIAKLQAELEAEERRKLEIIEARQLKVQWSEVNDGDRLLIITQDQNRFPLVPEDAPRLIELLESMLGKALEEGPRRQ